MYEEEADAREDSLGTEEGHGIVPVADDGDAGDQRLLGVDGDAGMQEESQSEVPAEDGAFQLVSRVSESSQ